MPKIDVPEPTKPQPSRQLTRSLNVRMSDRQMKVLEEIAVHQGCGLSAALRIAVEYARLVLIIEAADCSLADAMKLARNDLDWVPPYLGDSV